MSGSGLVAAGPTPAERTREFGPDSARAPVRAAMLKPGKREALLGLCCGKRGRELGWKKDLFSPSPTEKARGRGGPASRAGGQGGGTAGLLGCRLPAPTPQTSAFASTAPLRMLGRVPSVRLQFCFLPGCEAREYPNSAESVRRGTLCSVVS